MFVWLHAADLSALRLARRERAPLMSTWRARRRLGLVVAPNREGT